MLKFCAKRIIESIFVMLIVAFGAFVLFRFVGDPLALLISEETPYEERLAARESLGLDDPVIEQYLRYIGRALQGDFGISYQTNIEVSQLIIQRLPATIELTFAASLLVLFIGIPFGIYAAIRPNSFLTKFVMTSSLAGISLPSFFIGICLIYVFGVSLGWLPTYGRGEVVEIGWWSTGFLTQSGLTSLIMPTITLGLFQFTLIMRLVRSEMVEVLRTDYIRFAKARGLPDKRIHFVHALKNALIPIVTIMGVQIGSMLAFSIIAETVFQWPGVGLMFINAIKYVDIPVMSSYLVLVGAVFVFINAVVDILYYVIDPRIRS
jgi:peptide/nickel transport system permease protein